MYIHRKHVRANPNNSARRYSRRNLSVRTGPFGRSCCKKAEAASRKMRLTTVSVQRDCGATIAALCVLLDLNTHTHVHTYTHMYTRTHALMHTHMLHTRTHAQEHTHTPVLWWHWQGETAGRLQRSRLHEQIAPFGWVRSHMSTCVCVCVCVRLGVCVCVQLQHIYMHTIEKYHTEQNTVL